MSEIRVASTTDSEEDVNLAAGLPAEGEKPEEEAISEEGEKPSEEAESEPAKPEDEKKSSKSAAASETAKSEEEEDDEKESKGNRGYQKRIDKLTEDKYALRDQNRDLQERLERLEALLPKEQKPVVAQEDAKPARDKFKTDEEFFEALGRWSARDEAKKTEEANRAKASNDELAVVYSNYNEGVRTFKAENPDYNEVVGDSTLEIPTVVQTAIISYENEGPALAYFLAKNPDVVAKLAKMNDVRAVAEIGRIHAKLNPEVPEEKQEEKKVVPPQVKKPVARPPAPIKPTRAGATNTATPIDELPYADFVRVRREQEKGRIRR
jgi:hypothetical protein